MKKNLKKFFLYLLGCILIYIIITNVFIYPCKVKGMSMFPTISPNEIKLTNRWTIITKSEEIKRGDIILFEEPSVMYISQHEIDLPELTEYKYFKEGNL